MPEHWHGGLTTIVFTLSVMVCGLTGMRLVEIKAPNSAIGRALAFIH